jgi:hypothetical protein
VIILKNNHAEIGITPHTTREDEALGILDSYMNGFLSFKDAARMLQNTKYSLPPH